MSKHYQNYKVSTLPPETILSHYLEQSFSKQTPMPDRPRSWAKLDIGFHRSRSYTPVRLMQEHVTNPRNGTLFLEDQYSLSSSKGRDLLSAYFPWWTMWMTRDEIDFSIGREWKLVGSSNYNTILLVLFQCGLWAILVDPQNWLCD